LTDVNVNAMPNGSNTMSLPRRWNWAERAVARYEVACRVKIDKKCTYEVW